MQTYKQKCNYDIVRNWLISFSFFSFLFYRYFVRVDADLKNVVYCVGIRKGGEEEWEFAYRKYKESNVASEKSLLLEALTCTQKPWLITK